MYQDLEINALNNVYESLKELNNAQVKRIMDWVTGKFELEKHPDLKAHERKEESIPQPGPLPAPAPTKVEAAEPTVKPVKKRRGRPPAKAKLTEKKPVTKPAVPKGIKVFMKYNTFEDLFFSSNARTITAKILLAAAYIQEKRNIKEFSSFDINAQLKTIGHGVPNISTLINILLDKMPPMLIQTGRTGTSKKGRRTYSVTEEGLRIARNYINE